MMKISRMEIENVKRVKAVTLTPEENGLTVIGGRNGQGKTSVLDAIAWALGGDKRRPSDAAREGSYVPPHIRIEMTGGLVVERKGKNSALTVTDVTGRRAGQALLNDFIGELALDLPKFMEMTDKEKAAILLKIIGVGDRLTEMEKQEKALYDKRRAWGQIAEQKKAFANEMPDYPEAPEEPVSAYDLIQQQQAILAKNGENAQKRHQLDELRRQEKQLAEQMERKEEEWAAMRAQHAKICQSIETAQKTVEQLRDESTAELEESIRNIEDINRKVRANLDKEKAEEDAKGYAREYDKMSAAIDDIRAQKMDLLKGAQMPLPELSVEDGALTYKGRRWDCMSGAEQLQVATAIVRKLKPDCGFVLLDKLEQMDTQTLREFGAWLESEGMQAIATRVSSGSECSIIIEDGLAVTPENPKAEQPVPPGAPRKWQAGQF